jgi:hypothetical protein
MKHLKKTIPLFLIAVLLSSSLSIYANELADAVPKFDFVQSSNEVEISSLDNPALVLGAIIDRNTKNVRALDNYLKRDAKPIESTTNEVIFDGYVDKNMMVQASWLGVIKEIADGQITHVSLTKVSKGTINTDNIDSERLKADIKAIPENERTKYGIIIGYIVYKLKADTYNTVNSQPEAGTNGITISGRYYKHSESSFETNKIIAVCTPLPFQ